MKTFNTMRAAFQKAEKTSSGKVRTMIKKGLGKSAPRKKKAVCPVDEYEKELKRTFHTGWQGMSPCSFQKWLPGTPILADDKRGRVLWGLVDDKSKKVAIQFDSPQDVFGHGKRKTLYAIVDVKILSTCDCGGYVHTTQCKPVATTKQVVG